MVNKLLVYLAAPCILVFELMALPADAMTSARFRFPHLNARTQSGTAQIVNRRLARETSVRQILGTAPMEVEVISFTKLDPLPEYIPACEGCTAITVAFRVTCKTPEGCENLSVMDFYVTYESAYPTLFYGDEFPNPSLQGQEYGGIIYGSQKEFLETCLAAGETTIGELSLTVKPDASNFILHYHWNGHDEVDISVEVTNDTK